MLNLLRRGQLSKWFSGIGQEAVSVGLVAAPAVRRLAAAGAPQPRRVHGPRARPRGAVPPGPRASRRLRGGATARSTSDARSARRRHDQPPRGDGARGRRAGPRRPPPDGPRRRRAGRRRRHQRGRRPRGDEPGGGVAPRRAVRDREQPVGPVDAGQRAVRLRRPGRPGGGLRHAGPDRRRQRRRGGARCGGVGGRAGPGGQGPALLEWQDVPDPRPRGGVGHRLRAREEQLAAWVAATRSPASGPGSTSRGDGRRRAATWREEAGRGRPARGRGTRRRHAGLDREVEAAAGVRPGGPLRRAVATPRRRPGPRPRRYVDAVRGAARGPGRRRPRGAAGPGHRRLRRRVQGHRGPGRRVRHRPGAQHADHRVGAVGAALGLALDGFRPVLEMQFGDFVSCGFNQLVNNVATTRYRWGAPVPLVVRLPIGGGLGAGSVPLAERRGLVLPRPRAQGRRRRRRPTPRACCSPRSTTATPCSCSSTSGSTAAPAAPCHRGTTSCRWGRPASRARPRRHHRDVRGRRRLGRRRRRGGGRRRRRGRGGGPALAGAVGPRHGPRLRAPHVAALVLHEAAVTGGFGAEVAATIGTEAFAWLGAPVARVGGLDTPIPFAPSLESRGRPSPASARPSTPSWRSDRRSVVSQHMH